MKEQTVEVCVHIAPNGETANVSDMVKSVGQTPGVTHAHMNPFVDTLIDVEYMPERTNGQHIVDEIRHCGFNASLVGM